MDVSTETEKTLKSRYPRNVADLRRIEGQLQRVVKHSLPATVALQLGRSAGSGVIVNPEGLILTAGHVIGDSSRKVNIILPDGRRFTGKSLGANHDIDAGMVQMDNPPSDLPYTPIAKGTKLVPGEWVVTTGQPGGLVEGRAPPVRLGRVLFREEEVVCTDCTLVGGDSGGPLFNMRGELVGIHSSIGPRVTHNFHVATTGFESSWDRLLAGEVWGGQINEEMVADRPVIGVSGRTIDGRCVITRAIAGLPAANAGVKNGDVIVAIDGRPIDSFEELSRTIFFQEPGEKVKLTYERDGVEKTVEVKVITAGELRKN
ncbi:MAG: trypsin-like peptidase domain-containing protein [Lacipirellulaceae bacterium]